MGTAPDLLPTPWESSGGWAGFGEERQPGSAASGGTGTAALPRCTAVWVAAAARAQEGVGSRWRGWNGKSDPCEREHGIAHPTLSAELSGQCALPHLCTAPAQRVRWLQDSACVPAAAHRARPARPAWDSVPCSPRGHRGGFRSARPAGATLVLVERMAQQTRLTQPWAQVVTLARGCHPCLVLRWPLCPCESPCMSACHHVSLHGRMWAGAATGWQ